MFHTIELAVEAIQKGKKQFINNYITDPALKEAWTDYVNSQTAFLNAAINTGKTLFISGTKMGPWTTLKS